METESQATIIPMQQVPPVAVMQQEGIVQRGKVYVSGVRVLAIIQSITGFLAVIFGFALVFYERDSYDNLRFAGVSGIVGIVLGALICAAGALGIVSYKDPQNHCKNGFHMAFSILACCTSVAGIGFFSVGVSQYHRDCDLYYRYSDRYCTEKAFIGLLLFLETTEFIVALTSAIFTCLFACREGGCCCENSQRGVIIYPGNQQYILTSASGQTVMAPAYPPGSVPHYFSSGVIYPNQAGFSQSGGGAHVSSTMHYPNQLLATEASTVGAMQSGASVTYSSQAPPPAYQEKEQPGHAS